MPDHLTTGESIKRARQLRRMTQRDLAEAVGVNLSSVVDWESNKSFPARNKFVIEEVLGITITEPAQAAS